MRRRDSGSQSESAFVQSAPNPAGTAGLEGAPSSIPALAPPPVNVRLKRVKTVATEITKPRKNEPGITCREVRGGFGDRELFTLAYWVDGKRQREVYRSKAEGIAAAKTAGGDLGSGKPTAPDLSAQERGRRVGPRTRHNLQNPVQAPVQVRHRAEVAAKERLAKLTRNQRRSRGTVFMDRAYAGDETLQWARERGDRPVGPPPSQPPGSGGI